MLVEIQNICALCCANIQDKINLFEQEYVVRQYYYFFHQSEDKNNMYYVKIRDLYAVLVLFQVIQNRTKYRNRNLTIFHCLNKLNLMQRKVLWKG